MILPHDEPAIDADDLIIRRINPQHHVVPDNNFSCMRISSKAFAASTGPDAGMSVDIEKLIVAGGEDPKTYVVTPVFTGAVAFSASAIRSLGLWVGYDPLEENPYHGEVWNSTANRHNKFSKAQKDGLAAAAEWYVSLSGVQLHIPPTAPAT